MMNGVICVVLALASSNPFNEWPPPTVVDVVELNSAYWPYWDEFLQRWVWANPLDQTIGWKLDPDGIMHVDWWAMGHKAPVDYDSGYYVFWFSQNGISQRILARHVIRTFTNFDPERVDAAQYPVEWRAGLLPWLKLKQQSSWYYWYEE